MLEPKEYRDNTRNSRNRKLITKSYERYCKSLVNNTSDCVGKGGHFYTSSCECKKALKNCYEYGLDQKAADLISSLPLFFRLANECAVSVEDVLRLRQSCIDLYYAMAKAFKESGYIFDIVEL